MLSRIDAQPEGPRRAVKVASVIGRDFRSPLVAAAYPDLGSESAVHEDLVRLTSTRLIGLEDARARAFAFAHAVTREVAYDSLPYSVRTVLHGRVGDALEAEPDGPRRHLDLLAYHYARSEDRRRCGTTSVPPPRPRARRTPTRRRSPTSSRCSRSSSRTSATACSSTSPSRSRCGGDWAAAEDAVSRARDSAERQGIAGGVARARLAQADLARKQGRYAEAEVELDAAEATCLAIGDGSGHARVLHLRGTLASMQGHPERARVAYEASLALREALGDEPGVAALLTNLALVAEDEDDLVAAERLGQEALARRRALDDHRAVSVSLTNMGMLATTRGDLPLALERFTEAQALAEEVGDPWMVAVGHHNLGNLTRDLGDRDASAAHLRGALGAYAERDDRWSIAHLLEDVALWVLAGSSTDDLAAVTLIAAALRVREEIGAPRFPPTEAALERATARTRSRASAEDLDGAAAAGRSADLDAVLARAGMLLGAVQPASGATTGPV